MVKLKLKENIEVSIDDEDHERISKFKWGVTERLSTQRFYRVPTIIGRLAHNVAISLANEILNTRGILYDHKDRDPLNFQKLNLRPSSYLENSHNRGKATREGKSTSVYKGVCWCVRTNKWSSRITLKNTRKHLGYFDNEIEAAKAYDKAAIELHKEFAFINIKEQH